MIIKILTRHSPTYGSLLKYILKGAKASQVITHNLRSNTQEGYVNEFIANEAVRLHTHSNQIYMYHEIISMSANEDNSKITDAMLDDLAKKYISLRGSNGMFIGAVHRDKDHVHIHFMSSGTAYRTGKSFRLSKYELAELKNSFQDYHLKTYKELTQSTVRHGQHKEYVTDKKWQVQHREARKVAKEQLQATVTECFEKATTRKEFLESLQDNDLHFYERNGVPTGLIHEDIKIRFSRLNISQDQFLAKRPDTTEEQIALQAIQELREKHDGSLDFNKTQEYER